MRHRQKSKNDNDQRRLPGSVESRKKLNADRVGILHREGEAETETMKFDSSTRQATTHQPPSLQ
jgi:hypothetical protein